METHPKDQEIIDKIENTLADPSDPVIEAMVLNYLKGLSDDEPIRMSN